MKFPIGPVAFYFITRKSNDICLKQRNRFPFDMRVNFKSVSKYVKIQLTICYRFSFLQQNVIIYILYLFIDYAINGEKFTKTYKHSTL